MAKAKQASKASNKKLDLLPAIKLILFPLLKLISSNLPQFGNTYQGIFHTRHSLISQLCPDKRNCMGSKEEDKNNQTGTPSQQRKQREDKQLSQQRAEAKIPDIRKLESPRKTSSLFFVSPKFSYAGKVQGGNKSEHKVIEEEEEEEEEETQ